MPPIKLDIEMAHAENPFAGLANHGKGFGQQIVEFFAIFQPLPKHPGFLQPDSSSLKSLEYWLPSR